MGNQSKSGTQHFCFLELKKKRIRINITKAPEYFKHIVETALKIIRRSLFHVPLLAYLTTNFKCICFKFLFFEYKCTKLIRALSDFMKIDFVKHWRSFFQAWKILETSYNNEVLRSATRQIISFIKLNFIRSFERKKTFIWISIQQHRCGWHGWTHIRFKLDVIQ